jgi:hypothetical protein
MRVLRIACAALGAFLVLAPAAMAATPATITQILGMGMIRSHHWVHGPNAVVVIDPSSRPYYTQINSDCPGANAMHWAEPKYALRRYKFRDILTSTCEAPTQFDGIHLPKSVARGYVALERYWLKKAWRFVKKDAQGVRRITRRHLAYVESSGGRTILGYRCYKLHAPSQWVITSDARLARNSCAGGHHEWHAHF